MRTAVVVDDEPITRMDLRGMLEEQGFSVLGEAADGFDAIEVCRNTAPDVVLMDVKMPVFDGLTASETILDEGLAGCVVLLTAFSDADLVERANQIGVTGYLVKPVEERLLMPTIEVALAQSMRLKQLRYENREAMRLLEENKLIERAKSILAREKGISESEAYKELRQMSMNKRCQVATLAKAVLDNHSQRETLQKAKRVLIERYGLSETAAYKQIQEKANQSGIATVQVARDIIYSGKS